MKISDEVLEEYAERYVNEKKKQTTGLDFHEYLFAMIKLDQIVKRNM